MTKIDLKITVKTPKGQAKPCMVKQRDALLGFKKQKQIKEEKLISDSEFYWIVPADDQADAFGISNRLAKGEIKIKNFYRTLIKMIDRGNKLANKFKKGVSWIRRWIIKKLRKQEQHEFVKQVEEMSDEELKDFMQINDREEMMQLLSGSLIDVEEIN
jgi:hypothetical protein